MVRGIVSKKDTGKTAFLYNNNPNNILARVKIETN